MPNHVTNQIRVIGGTNKQRLAFIRAITNKRGQIDFNSITRMPKSMHIDESTDVKRMASAIAGSHMADFFFGDVETVEEVTAELRARGYQASHIKKVKQQAQMRIDNKRRHGFYSWYDWSRAKWGTKWNAYSVEMPVERKRQRVKRGHKRRETHVRAYSKRVFKKHLARHAASGAELVIRFETAWNYRSLSTLRWRDASRTWNSMSAMPMKTWEAIAEGFDWRAANYTQKKLPPTGVTSQPKSAANGGSSRSNCAIQATLRSSTA